MERMAYSLCKSRCSHRNQQMKLQHASRLMASTYVRKSS